TVTLSGAGYMAMGIHEYAGFDPASPLDSTSTGNGTQAGGTTASTGTVAVNGSNEMIFAVFGQGYSQSWTPGAGYTSRYSNSPNGSNEGILDEDQMGLSSSASATCTYAAGNSSWPAIAASFK